uniref:Uncharacterized protein n=1 Tax=Anopheles funestus TaxID=62324 RepID=A0A182S0R8_ANOFN
MVPKKACLRTIDDVKGD